MPDEDDTTVTRTPDQTSGGDSGGRTLLPMLIAGLILIVLGATVIVLFVYLDELKRVAVLLDTLT